MKSEQTMTELKEAIIAIANDGATGAALGGITGIVLASRRNPRTLTPLFQFGGMCALNCSASFAGWTATEYIMKGIRGRNDDLTARMGAASGGGLAYSFVSQGLKVKPAHALYWAASYAVAAGTVHMVIDLIAHEPIQKNISVFFLLAMAFVLQVMETIRARSELSTSGKASDT